MFNTSSLFQNCTLPPYEILTHNKKANLRLIARSTPWGLTYFVQNLRHTEYYGSYWADFSGKTYSRKCGWFRYYTRLREFEAANAS